MIVVVCALLALCGLFFGIAASTNSSEAEALFGKALAQCHLSTDSDATLGDGGSTLVLNGASKGSSRGIEYDDESCILRELQTPDAVQSQMNSTRALDGMQSASWSGITAKWTYHPDDGLDITFTRI